MKIKSEIQYYLEREREYDLGEMILEEEIVIKQYQNGNTVSLTRISKHNTKYFKAKDIFSVIPYNKINEDFLKKFEKIQPFEFSDILTKEENIKNILKFIVSHIMN